MNQPLGPMIRKLRMRAALAIGEAAEKAGMSKSFLCLVETRGAKMSRESARRLAPLIGLDGDELAARYWLQRVPADLWPAMAGVLAKELATPEVA